MTLHDVSELDSGVYTVAINVEEFDTYRTYTHSVVVDVVGKCVRRFGSMYLCIYACKLGGV